MLYDVSQNTRTDNDIGHSVLYVLAICACELAWRWENTEHGKSWKDRFRFADHTKRPVDMQILMELGELRYTG